MASSAQPDAAATSTLLLEAAELGDLAAVQRALADGASASVSTSFGTGALSLAASKGHTAVVEALLRAGADAAAKNSFGETALDLATQAGHGACAKLLPGGSHNFGKLNARGAPCARCGKVVGRGRAGLWCASCGTCKECALATVCGAASPSRRSFGFGRRSSASGGERSPASPLSPAASAVVAVQGGGRRCEMAAATATLTAAAMT